MILIAIDGLEGKAREVVREEERGSESETR